MTVTTPVAVHVVIPAHNEAALIERCLTSVRDAAAHLLDSTGVAATVTVVADSCTDSTVEVARQYGAEVLVLQARCVGRARDAGVRQVLASSGTSDGERVWIAMTDADSTVTPDWLEFQHRAATGGIGLWIGSVQPDPVGVSAPVLREWVVRHHPSDQVHVHGANLGFTATTFLGAGGFPPLPEHEDRAFVRAALASGSTWSAGGPTVRTSGRTHGRTPGGFAGYVRKLVADLEDALAPVAAHPAPQLQDPQ
jgi:glycosyltransferase involved in cell wall biosynthesis